MYSKTKFVFQKPFIKNYPVCALFTVRLHNGCSSSQSELTTLKTLIYQLDAALEKYVWLFCVSAFHFSILGAKIPDLIQMLSFKVLFTFYFKIRFLFSSPDAQRNGINFIYDMNNCKRSNYDLTLSQKILTLVRVNWRFSFFFLSSFHFSLYLCRLENVIHKEKFQI